MKKKILIAVWLFLAVLCFLYGIIVRSVGSGTAFFIVWIGLAIVFGFFAIAVWRELWQKIPNVLRKVFLALVCIGMACFVVIEGCVVSGMHAQGEAGLDYIIVLGAQVYESGPSAVLKFRLDKAIEYLEENPDPLCVVSGGQGYNEPFSESLGMAQYLEEHGISENRIILESESLTTKENISNSRKLIEEHSSVGVVTNNFHVFRAVWTAKNQGLENVCGIAADTTKLYLPNNMFREFFGVVKYMISR